MKKQALSLAVCIAGAYPLSSGAIGLGDIRSSSHLNQPLNAKIELLSTSVQEAKQIKVRLASVDVFNRVGIERPDYLNSLRFTPTIQNGKPVILVSSTQAIKEPFLNFLLEVSWPKGQLLKEYTVLLDPPTLLQTSQTTESNTATVRAEPKSVGFVKRPHQTQQRVQTHSQQQVHMRDGITVNNNTETKASTQQTVRKSKYRVRSGDTLYKIASRIKPRGISSDQMMVALFRANPEAFRKGNINRLKAGVTLKVPSNADYISTREAKRLIRKHYAEWKQYRKKLAKKTLPQKQSQTNSHTENKSHSKSLSSHDNKIGATKPSNKARLEVMGSKNSGNKNSSNISAAGKARIAELDKQLALAREALISKQRENAELKSRISEMESIIQKKNRLIELKNEQLAKLQRSLANARNSTENTNNTATPSAASVNRLTTVNTDLSTHLANKANQEAGKIIRAQVAGSNGQQNTQANTPDTQQHENKLAPAALAEKRRAVTIDATKQEQEVQELTPEETGFKPEKKNALLDLLSSPIVTAAGAGTIFLLLLGWWLLYRRKNTSSDDHANDATSPDFDDDITEFSTPEKVGKDDEFITEFEKEPKTPKIGDEEEVVTPKEVSETDNISNRLDDEDDIIQEADVYIVYGLHEQAETELKKAIAEHPEKLEYRHKLLENYLAANNKEAFDLQAQELHDLDGNNKADIWEKVIEMGRKISPDNPLYQTINNDSRASNSTEKKITTDAATVAGAGVTAAMSSDTDISANNAQIEIEEVEDDLDKLLLDDDITDTKTNHSNEMDQDEQAQQIEVAEDIANLDLDDDFNLDDLEKELNSSATELASDRDVDNSQDNVIDFESMLLDDDTHQKSTNDELDIASLNLEVDNETGIDRILPKGTAYTAQGNTEMYTEEDDDILSFLDLPEEGIDLQEAHISTKLDLARAYLDMGDIEGARSTLEEVIVEGSDKQKQEAEELLHQTG